MKKINTIMDEDRRNVIIEGIENFIETKNRYIQVILALITVIAGAIYGFAPEDAQTAIRYVLIMDLFVEIYIADKRFHYAGKVESTPC